MSIDLTRGSDVLGLYREAWMAYLGLATAYGWEPAGTTAPPGYKDWDGDYSTNDGQGVTAADARAIAASLRSYLDDPGRATTAHEVLEVMGVEYPVEQDDPAFVPRLVAFLEQGALEIN